VIAATARGALIVGLLVATACGWLSAGTPPDDRSAEAHRREAAKHSGEAAEHLEGYDPEARGVPCRRWYGRATSTRRTGGRGAYPQRYRYPYCVSDFYWATGEYNPTAIHLTHAADHERRAREHLEAARALEQFEEEQCQAFPPETRVVCPLLGQVDHLEDVSGGVRLQLGEGVNVNAAVAHMLCHQAFARTRGSAGMDECPLYLPGVRVERIGRSRSVELTDPEDVDELRRRARMHLGLQATE